MCVRTHLPAPSLLRSIAMTKLLHISASPRGERSESLGVAASFLDTFRSEHPGVPVETYDLWDGTLPAFGPDAAAAKMALFAGSQPQGAAWQAAVDTFHRFDAADRYLFSVPMWNAGVPYVLKQFIDVVSQPGLVFGFDPERGYRGLLAGKKAVVIYTSAVYGADRGPAFGEDFQAPFFTGWLRWAGVEDVAEVHFRPNLAVADAEPGRRYAHEQARDLAKRFA
jgi:FMN-dependent NADH-azoreductase